MFKLKMILSKVRFFSSIFICLALISCGNLFEDDISEKEDPKEKTQIKESSSENQIISEIPYLPGQTFVLNGSMILDGAMPSFTSENRAALSRAALPELSASEVEYFVYAKDSDDNKVNGSFGEGENSKTFSIPLIFDKQWTVTCGMRKKTGNQEEFLTASSTPKTYTSENYTDPLVLYPQPATDGEGEIALSISIPSTISNVGVECVSSNKNDWKNISVTRTTEAGATAVLIKSDDSEKIKSGVYKIKLGFYTGSELVYQITQSINVFYGMTTTLWYDAGGAGSSSPIQSGSFQLTETNLKQFKATNFYVGATGAQGAADPADTNSGTHKAPFATLERALNQIKEYGLETNDYKIHISGSLTPTAGAGFNIDSDFDDKMKSLTLIGVSSKTTDIISGNETYNALQITTSKKVVIKDLTITKGSTTKGGGIYYYGTGKLVVDNCIIKENAAAQSGGAIYSSGTVEVHSTDITNNSAQALGDAIFLLNGTYTMFGGEVSANTTSADDSGTIFVQKNATFILESGEIKNNTSRAIYNHGIVEIENGTISGHTTAKKGAGIYNNGSVTINGGTISGNTSDENGGGIYVNIVTESATPSLTINGGTISGNSSASYGGGICNSSTLTITGGEISGNQTTGTSESAGGAIASFVDFTIGANAYIPAGTEGKNDIYLYDSGDNVSKFHILLSSPLASHDSTDKIKLTPAVYAEARPMIALAASSTADLTVEYEKFSVSTDAAGYNYTISNAGLLKPDSSGFINKSVTGSSFAGTSTLSDSEVFVSGRSFNIRPIEASDHEVTQSEYETYCIYSGSGTEVPTTAVGKGCFYPVYYVSWYDTLVYCNLRTIAEMGIEHCVYSIGDEKDPSKWNGKTAGTGENAGKYCGPTGTERNDAWDAVTMDTTADGWRLPVEVEWEYLAREGKLTGDQYTYSGSNNIDNVAYYKGSSETNNGSKAHEVKGKTANSLGLYDMTGNVFEWVWDWYTSPLNSSMGVEGPTYAQANSGKEKIFCGGAYSKTATDCKLSKRGWYQPPHLRFADIGFRVVRGAITAPLIGSKAPDEAKAVGDIVFNDGSAMPYSEFDVLDDDSKIALKTQAIALIFYKGTGLNSGDDTITSRTLGVGIKHLISGEMIETLACYSTDANANELNITTTVCESSGGGDSSSFTGDKNGSDNLEQIAAFLKSQTLENDTGVGEDCTTTPEEAAALYPAFYYAKNYKTLLIGSETESRIISGSEFENGWYLPSAAELFYIYKNGIGNSKMFDLNTANKALGGIGFTGTSTMIEYQYVSSSQAPGETNTTWNCIIRFTTYNQYTGLPGSMSVLAKTSTTAGVCAIREF